MSDKKPINQKSFIRGVGVALVALGLFAATVITYWNYFKVQNPSQLIILAIMSLLNIPFIAGVLILVFNRKKPENR